MEFVIIAEIVIIKHMVNEHHTTKPILSKKRHLLKAVTYRVYSSSITFLISFLITGNCTVGLSIGVLDFTVKIFSYYFHERIWYRVNFGKHTQINASKEDTIKWMAQRIKDEQRKHSSFFDDWHDIAARKIYATLISKNK